MEEVAVYCSWADKRFLGDASLTLLLPPELISVIRITSGPQYLDAISAATRLSPCTDSLFTLYRPLIPEIAARWLGLSSRLSFADNIQTFSSLVRILPFAPYLRWHVKALLSQNHDVERLRSADCDLSELPEDQIQCLLLAFFRLFTYDSDTFTEFLHPALLPRLFGHNSSSVRYLAIQCLSQSMRFADAFVQKLVEKHVGREPIKGKWEGISIDYRLLKLFEEKRWKKLQDDLRLVKVQSMSYDSAQFSIRFTALELCDHTAEIAGVLLPRHNTGPSSKSTFIQTPTARRNLRLLAEALLATQPIILAGKPGSGKTSLVLEAARALNKFSDMITLQLNEQTDTKSLIGLHTTSPTGDSFIWQPGVLTRALQEGRWVLIEDIERAPSEVIGILRPLLENKELFIPSRKEYVNPAEGFRIFATTRETNLSGKAQVRNLGLSNTALWTTIQCEPLDGEQTAALIRSKFPGCDPFVESMMTVHQTVFSKHHEIGGSKALQTRPPSLRDLLKWARRIGIRLINISKQVQVGAIPQSTKVDIFKDAVDCYAQHVNSESVRIQVVSCIAAGMQISPQQMNHVLKDSVPEYSKTTSATTIGRAQFATSLSSRRQTSSVQSSPFALTRQTRTSLETIASAVSLSEPVLLVGETGVGKTTLVQHLADTVGQKLTVVNLSQQSEATDLLGGLKPVTLRSLLVPLVDEFSALFDDTFSNKRNEKFHSSLRRCVKQENWHRLVLLWQEALQMAYRALKVSEEIAHETLNAPQSKRRRLATPKYQKLRDRWAEFARNLEQVSIQAARGEARLVFAFVEGRLVQAVRNGEWLLLDEINLASPDTLDHIVSLLHNGDDGQVFLQLSDSGSMERIMAHKEFRLFAAMNPANDASKRDLAPGIRSRFTEIFIHPGDDNLDDLVDLIKTYVGPMLAVDDRAASDLANTYLSVKKLNEETCLTDGAGDLPHFTLRSLVRCLQYVSAHAATFGLRRAICEGFAMSFFTALSKESELLVQPILFSHILSAVRNPGSFLTQTPKTPFDPAHYVTFQQHQIVRGPSPSQQQTHYIITPSVQRNLLNLARATSMRRYPILLQGPTSVGKTSMVEYLANLTGNKFIRVNNHEQTDLQEYLGSYVSGQDGKLEFKDGVLVDAIRHGHWIALDELNLAASDILEALNRLLDDNRELLIPESQEIIHPHPNFMLFATQNPAGLYGGRKRLSRAFRNRFLELHFDDIPEDELEVILRERSQIPPSFCAQIVAVYKKLMLQRQSTRLFEQRNSFATLRDLFRWAARPADDRLQLAQNGFLLLAERVRDSRERQIVKKTIEDEFRFRLDENVLYRPTTIPMDLKQSSHVVWTPAMRRLFTLVTNALHNNEPVLLVGETGCGKTQICQIVALAMGKKLNTYNAHTNTETGDLIGSLRPVRNRTELAAILKSTLNHLLGSLSNGTACQNTSVDALLQQFNAMDVSKFDSSVVSQLRAMISAYNSLFRWVDGSLVQAMKSGEYFLLDEISLADDSVLERLNSVLEPSRAILLAEKGADDNFVIASSGFQFIATMNPGGDYGKRELSAALRNRLTEIWVPPLTASEDILPILQSRLNTDKQHLAVKMLEFADWFQEQFHSAQATAAPLRTLLTWADFMNGCSHVSLEAAFLHGTAMVYIDSLGANPAGMTAGSIADIDGARSVCLEKVGRLLDFNAALLYQTAPNLHVDGENVTVGDFSLPSRNKCLDDTGIVFQAPTTLQNTMRIVRALQMSKPLLLEGSPGVGKTAIVTALAKTVGKELFRINLSDQTDLMDLFGADVPSESGSFGTFTWRDGPLLTAMQSGSWILLDEMNLASQSVLEGLNSCLDHRKEIYVADLDRTFSCHPEFRLFAAQNPHYQGGGRKGLPSSFVNRFTVVYADAFRMTDLEFICRSRFPDMPPAKLKNVLDTVVKVQEEVNQNTALAVGMGGFNLRDVTRWLDLVNNYPALDPGCHFQTIIAQRFQTSEQKKAIEGLNTVRSPSMASSLYSNLSPLSYQIGTVFLKRDPVFQHVPSALAPLPTRLLQYAKSVVIGLNHAWPVIISGPSGCGKTTLIRRLAALSGSRLVELSLNSDVDTMDLIGGFEQYDAQRELAELTLEIGCLAEEYASELLSRSDIGRATVVIDLYQVCSTNSVDLKVLRQALVAVADSNHAFRWALSRLEKLEQQEAKDNVKFVWNDGVLVNALESGSWLVLDNANQCSASVLDRLNSLLEPEGTLIVSENHTSGGGPRVIRPHKNFRVLLIVNPQYGELSRAMRNRSLEIHIPADDEIYNADESPSYLCASEISRLRLLSQAVDCDENPRTDLVCFAIEHLSRVDIGKLDSKSLHLFNLSKSPLSDLLEIEASLPPILYDRSQEALALSSVSQLDIPSQAIMPAVNEPLLAISADPDTKEAAEGVFHARQLLVQLTMIANQLRRANQAAAIGKSSESTILERSSKTNNWQGSQSDSIPGIYPFYNLLCNLIKDSFQQMLSVKTGVFAPQVFEASRSIVNIAQDFLSFFASKKLDRAIFQAHLQIAQTTAKTIDSQSTALARSFTKALAVLGAGFELSTGNSLQRLWDNWRPRTPSSSAGAENLEKYKQIVANFEKISSCSPGFMKLLPDIRTKLFEVREMILSYEDYPADVYLREIAGVLTSLDSQTQHRISINGHFAPVFEFICQAIDFKETRNEFSELNTLSLFARRSMLISASPSREKPVPYTLSTIASLHGSKAKEAALDLTGENLGSILLAKLASCENQPLNALDYATEELSTLAASICKHACSLEASRLQQIKSSVENLISLIISSHADMINKKLNRTWVSNDEFLGAVQTLWNDQELLDDSLAAGRNLHEILQIHLMPALSWMRDSSLPEKFRAGAGLMNFSLAALKLFVPDRPFDPAILPVVRRDNHIRHVSYLKRSIEAIMMFQLQFTGQKSSLIIRMIEEELANVGQELEAPAVIRPKVSRLVELCEEFSTLQRAILSPDSWTILLGARGQDGRNPDSQRFKASIEGARMQRNIGEVLRRLSQFDGTYDDLCKPVIWILKCLHVGIELTTSLDVLGDGYGQVLQQLCSHTPMLVPGPTTAKAWRFQKVNDLCISSDLRVQWLQHLSLRAKVLKRGQDMTLRSSMRDFLAVMDTFHQEWKLRLEKGQTAMGERTRYYAYRSQNEENDDFEAQEQAKLFPTFDEADETVRKSGEPPSDVRVITLKIAELHSRIILLGDSETSLRAYLEETAEALAELTSHSSNNPCGLSLAESLPVIMIQMDKMASSLRGEHFPAKINIYKDGSIPEIQKLRKLTLEVERRFQQIGEAWPEHAVPIEVQQYCREILLIKFNEPIAKLLTKTEKLFAAVDRWQAVASREYSAANLQAQLSDLIISWRRLELSSWSSLLDLETVKYEEDARAWYFILYEAIFVNTRAIMDNGVNLPTYSEELLRTLEEFLNTAPGGQFAPRMRLLEQFKSTLEILSIEDSRFQVIGASVLSVITHYKRYETDIAAALRADRLKLEKAIQEQIKLSTWRDSNPISLKEGARRSHNKLFRIVRKYRAVLEKPAGPFPAPAAPKIKDIRGPLPSLEHLTEDVGALRAAISYCRDAVSGWENRPERLTNPSGAAGIIARVYQSLVGDFASQRELASFHQDLINSINELRSKTPGSLTEENQSLLRNLREQKKRLLADTFKALSKMGVKRNLSGKELDSQSSTARVLSRSPPLDASSMKEAERDLNTTFHDFLDIIHKARLSLSQHSDDLTNSEVRRGLGFLEGMLSIMIRQRNSISANLSSLRKLSVYIRRLEALEHIPLDEIVLDEANIRSTCSLTEDRLSWLVEMLELAVNILEIHSRHENVSRELVRQVLLNYSSAFGGLLQDFQKMKTLPDGFRHTADSIVVNRAFAKMQEVETKLRSFAETDPNIDYIIRQLVPWTDTNTMKPPDTTKRVQHCTLEDFDSSVRQVLDQVFVAVQQMGGAKSELVQSSEDNEWLIKSDNKLNARARSLHLNQISHGLEAVFAQVPYISVEDAQAAAAIMVASKPILQQYFNICRHVADSSIALHFEMTQMATSMATTFTMLTAGGFCRPSEVSDEPGASDQLEAGTGLGEGEGAEDISKDVGEDEDLTEFAEAENAQREDDIGEASKDAVDMGPDDLNGDTERFDDLPEYDISDRDEQEGIGDEVDEEVGSVDDLDPSTVDEKMWDDAKQDAEKELKGDKTKGKQLGDQNVADKNQDGQAEEDSENEDGPDGLEEEGGRENDDNDAVARTEAENLDPHLDEDQVMELPENMQLNGEEKEAEEMSDGGMDEFLDVDDARANEAGADEDDGDVDGNAVEEEFKDRDDLDEEDELKETTIEDENMEDAGEADQEKEPRPLENDMQFDHENQQAAEAVTAGGPQGQDECTDQQSTIGLQENQQQQGQGNAEDVPSTVAGDDHSPKKQHGQGSNETVNGIESETLKKLADVLDRWHQRHDIMTASGPREQPAQDNKDVEMNEAEFEHIANEEDEGDAQASGMARQDQAKNLQGGAMIEDKENAEQMDQVIPEIDEDQADEATIEEQLRRLQTSSTETDRHGGAFIPKQQKNQVSAKEIDAMDSAEEFSVVPKDATANAAVPVLPSQPTLSIETASKLWSRYSASTHQHSLILTEQLRLILAPTLVTKLRGDYRTGKRLNIKRIIPYIASQYKRDKIWMRRSVPSKRAYQIMIAVDDSKSMMEGGVGALALETVAMLCKSLSMLEVGELSVVAFGNEDKLRIAQPFGKPFSNDVGPSVFEAFSFSKPSTNVRRLVAESVDLFRDARAKSPSASQSSELWQLQLIISDGICEEHERIQQLVRQAKEEKIMIVFVIVDSVGIGDSSIMDLTQASFEPDINGGGEMKLTMRRYLERFPFPYYLVVRDVRDLPGVLATALKGWFGQVVDVQ